MGYSSRDTNSDTNMADPDSDSLYAVTVAVADHCPSRRLGLRTILARAGFRVEEPSDLFGWIASTDLKVIVMVHDIDEDIEYMAALQRKQKDVILVVLTPGTSASACRRALLCGASAIVEVDAELSTICNAIVCAIDRRASLPIPAARSLAADARDKAASVSHFEQQELLWLQGLADGKTIRQVAVEAGYSIRRMNYLLADIYDRLGTHSRTRAVVNAVLLGLVK